MSNVECQMWKCRKLNVKIQDSKGKIEYSKFKSLKFKVQSLGFKVQGLEFLLNYDEKLIISVVTMILIS